MKVFRAFQIVDNDIVADDVLPSRCGFTIADVVGPLTNLTAVADAVAGWRMELLLAVEDKREHVNLSLEPFIFQDELDASETAPVSFHDLRAVQSALASSSFSLKPGRWLWLFRKGFYVTERPARESEVEQVHLAIKVRHYQSDTRLKRLRAEVANFEALDQVTRGFGARRPLRDDVKLLVWARDGGQCVACQAAKDLQFDHIIPFSRGGSDEADNIQLLCRGCNLAKSDRLA